MPGVGGLQFPIPLLTAGSSPPPPAGPLPPAPTLCSGVAGPRPSHTALNLLHSESSPSDVPQSPTEPPPSQEKKKEKAPERRVSAPARPRGPRAQNRKAIVDKFGG